MIYKNFADLVGKTPLYEASLFSEKEGLSSHLLVKLECFNPAGSVKDRVAVNMLLKAKEKGLITEGATVIEPTSGNTGIGLAAAAVSMGYKAILVMPDTMSVERQKLLKAYGAEIVLTEGAKKSICVSTGSPFVYNDWFPSAENFLNLYCACPEYMQALVEGIYGECDFTGICPYDNDPLAPRL